jgi:hypothetical protein
MYLMEARKHEHHGRLDPEKLPHRDVGLTEEFVNERFDVVSALGSALGVTGMRINAVDSDGREALDSLIQSYQTLKSGVIYESLPTNPIAAELHRTVKAAAEAFIQSERDALGLTHTRDSDIMKALVFLEIVSIDRDNGRRYGRAFMDALMNFQAPEASSSDGAPNRSSLLLP